jgi:hypothetical protein
MGIQLEELNQRLGKLEQQNTQEILTLIEMLSNATFFGTLKKANCEFAKNGQCSFFALQYETKNKIPIVTDCRIKDCNEPTIHSHIELSNITCAFCQLINQGPKNALHIEKTSKKKRQSSKKVLTI